MNMFPDVVYTGFAAGNLVVRLFQKYFRFDFDIFVF